MPRGTLYVQKEMPVKVVEPYSGFATRGIPGQGPPPERKVFVAPHGYPFENEAWRTGVYDHFERKRLRRESRSATARELRTSARSDDLKRWESSSSPAQPQLTSANTVIKRPARPQSASVYSAAYPKHPDRAAERMPYRRPKSASVPTAPLTSSSSPTRLSQTVPARRKSKTNEIADAALRRSMGIGKDEDLLDALLANASPRQSPERMRRRSSYGEPPPPALLVDTIVDPSLFAHRKSTRPLSAGPRFVTPT